jgi:hypothetical protein
MLSGLPNIFCKLAIFSGVLDVFGNKKKKKTENSFSLVDTLNLYILKKHCRKADYRLLLLFSDWFDIPSLKKSFSARFNRKAGMRETWLSENQRLVSQDNFGFDLAAVEAAAKKHEAIETDIFAYEERVTAVEQVAMELEQENYHDIDRINARKDNVLRLWNYLLELLRARRSRLERSLLLQHNFQAIIY